ncbi:MULTISPECIES: iron chaperone [Actinomadura]|uniref:YdhG-like domain-containing protein n=1 Tax=Actinomadura litoris TaxID=2678616 RepID=A0A7K1L2P2_9ACTN|nr:MULTISPECIES: DUF1801 domain-containing protein [Actinomadura]MUN38681.1 hypothetical protein [Actinomadura litoris]
MSETPKAAKGDAATGKNFDGFSEDERAAMKEHAKELKKAARRSASEAKAREEGERDVREKIAEMPEADRVLAERLHEIIASVAPGLVPRTWYGMPAYAKDGKVLCFFQSAQKFKSRYATLGFSDVAALDDGTLWPTTYALTALDAANEAVISDLVKRAVG